MSGVKTVRHRASISGYVTDAYSGACIGGAIVELVALGRQMKAGADGFFHFLDLPNGSYTLRVSAPHLGSRYGTLTVKGVQVANETLTTRLVFDPKANIALPPTRLAGLVKRSNNSLPVAQVDIWLPASNVRTKSSKEGTYVLSGIEAGTQTVQVSAPGFAAVVKKVSLTAGKATTQGFSLTPS